MLLAAAVISQHKNTTTASTDIGVLLFMLQSKCITFLHALKLNNMHVKIVCPFFIIQMNLQKGRPTRMSVRVKRDT